jgi:hypothetical protein
MRTQVGRIKIKIRSKRRRRRIPPGGEKTR